MKYQTRERKSAFIHVNDTGRPGLVCGAFHALSYYIGCPYKCSYCYLQGTFRGKVDPVVYSNRERLLAELDEWLAQPGHLRLNAGELEDSLALDGVIPLVDDLVPRFAAQTRHKLLLVTKSANIRNLLKHEARGQVIVAFSVNAPEVSERFEQGAPHPLKRVRAAAQVKEAGYYVTLRLDPMIPIEGWERAYATFLNDACAVLTPDQWTLGTLRYFPSLPGWARRLGRDSSVFSYARERFGGDGRMRITFDLRAAMYRLGMREIGARQPGCPVRLCKETVDMHREVGSQQQGCCYSQAMGNGG